MDHTVQVFQLRLRCERSFRQRILAARKAGTLAETLVKEGYAFDLRQLDVHLPQVQTGIRPERMTAPRVVVVSSSTNPNPDRHPNLRKKGG